MVFNPLFIQNSSSRDSAMLGKASGLKGKGYLFSDMMQVCLGGQVGVSKKLEQFLSANSEIDADGTNTNLFKLTEGNISSEKDVKFELLLQFLGVSSEELPEQTGLSLEIPTVTSEELKSMLAKITANADNESELNQVIDEKLLESAEENGENLLVTLQFNNKTIAIDIVPDTNSKNPEVLTEDGKVGGSVKNNSVFNITVSVLPSDVSDNIIAKFVESNHLLKKEAEGTAQVGARETSKLQLLNQNGQTGLAEAQAKTQIDDLVSKASESTPDLAKKVTIYSVVNGVDKETGAETKQTVETSFTNPLKQIKLNNQTASLSGAGNSKIANMMGEAEVAKQNSKPETQIPKAGSSFTNTTETATPGNKLNTKVDHNEQQVVTSKSTDSNSKIIKEGDVKTNFTKPVVETFSEDSKVISSPSEKASSKETLSAQLLNNLIDDSGKKVDNQNKVTVKTSEQGTSTGTKALNETELEIPANEKVTISIKKESASVKTTNDAKQSSDQIKVATEKAVQNSNEINQTANKLSDSKEVNNKNENVVKDFEKVLKNTSDDTSEKSNDEVKDKTDKNIHHVKSSNENNSDTVKDLKTKVNNSVENKVSKETLAKEKTDEIIKENPVKPNETVNAKTESETDNSVSQTNTKEGEVLRELSGTDSTSSEHKHSNNGENHQSSHFTNATHSVDHLKAKASFDESMANNQTQKTVHQSQVVKEVHQFVERKDNSQLVLNVEPADLGKVKVTLEMADKIVKVNVEVESEVIRQALEKSMSDLGQQLSKSGLQLGSVNISLQNADKGNKQNQPNKKKSDNKAEGGSIVENETGETQAGKSLGYNTYDYVV